jgi:hypothetical protein
MGRQGGLQGRDGRWDKQRNVFCRESKCWLPCRPNRTPLTMQLWQKDSGRSPATVHTPGYRQTSRVTLWRVTSQPGWYSNWGTSWTIVGSGFVSRKGQQILIFNRSSRSALGTNQPPMSAFLKLFQVGTTFISQNVLRTALLLSALKANLSCFKCSELMLTPAYVNTSLC